MCKKLMFLISFVSLLGLVGSASAVDRTWTNAYPWSMLWSSAQNWDPVGVPGPSDRAYINPDDVDPLAPAVEPNQGPVIDSNMVVGEVRGPRDSGSVAQTARVLAGDVTVNGNWTVANSGSGTATLLISGDSDVYIDGRLTVGASGTSLVDIGDTANVSIGDLENFVRNDAIGTLSIGDDATVMVRGDFGDAGRDDSQWTLNVSGNAVLTLDDEAAFGGGDSVGVINVTDNAQLICNDRWMPSDNDSSFVTVTIDVNAYVVTDGRLRMNGPSELLITDDAVVEVGDYFRMADEGDSYVTLTVSGNGVLDVGGGDFQIGDDGTGEISVSDNASITAGDMDIPRSGLAASLSISGGEINASNLTIPDEGSCTYSMTGGLVTTEGFRVGRSNGTLAYMDGGLVDTDEFDHEDNYLMDFTGGMLKINGDHYLEILGEVLAGRITGYGGCGGRGDIMIDYNNVVEDHTLVWAVSNPYRAWNPSPTCGAEDQDPAVTLSWNAGDGADLHHIFLSTDMDCVNTGDLACWKGVQTGTSFDPGGLLLGQTYYWRIETVDTDIPKNTHGQLWSFSIRDNVIEDDMEDYDDDTNPIWDTWLDGCGDSNGAGGNGTGSCVYTSDDIFNGDNSQSMLYYYDNSGQDIHNGTRDCNYSVAKRTFDAPQDWTLYAAETLELMFYGDPDNDATALEAMYLVVSDGTNSAMIVYGSRAPESLDDMKAAEWQQWDIPLSDFTDAGVDVTSVVSMSIGFGDPTNCHREPGGFGVMYIDDIALYPHRCVPKYTPDIYDTNEDCVVDWGDVETMAGGWLVDER